MLNVYKIDDGGEVFWVAAETPEGAMRELTLVLGEHYEEDEQPTTTLVSESDLDRIKIKQGKGSALTLREELAACIGPMLIGGTCF